MQIKDLTARAARLPEDARLQVTGDVHFCCRAKVEQSRRPIFSVRSYLIHSFGVVLRQLQLLFALGATLELTSSEL